MRLRHITTHGLCVRDDMRADEIAWGRFDPEPDPGEAAYARCAEECRERVAGEPECPETCLRADAARRADGTVMDPAKSTLGRLADYRAVISMTGLYRVDAAPQGQRRGRWGRLG